MTQDFYWRSLLTLSEFEGSIQELTCLIAHLKRLLCFKIQKVFPLQQKVRFVRAKKLVEGQVTAHLPKNIQVTTSTGKQHQCAPENLQVISTGVSCSSTLSTLSTLSTASTSSTSSTLSAASSSSLSTYLYSPLSSAFTLSLSSSSSSLSCFSSLSSSSLSYSLSSSPAKTESKTTKAPAVTISLKSLQLTQTKKLRPISGHSHSTKRGISSGISSGSKPNTRNQTKPYQDQVQRLEKKPNTDGQKQTPKLNQNILKDGMEAIYTENGLLHWSCIDFKKVTRWHERK